jgi:hypothetical protein
LSVSELEYAEGTVEQRNIPLAAVVPVNDGTDTHSVASPPPSSTSKPQRHKSTPQVPHRAGPAPDKSTGVIAGQDSVSAHFADSHSKTSDVELGWISVSIIDVYLAIVKAKTALPVRCATIIIPDSADANMFVLFSSDNNFLVRRKSGVRADNVCTMALGITDSTPQHQTVAYHHDLGASRSIAFRRTLNKAECASILGTPEKMRNCVIFAAVAAREPLYACKLIIGSAQPASFGTRDSSGFMSDWTEVPSDPAVCKRIENSLRDAITGLGVVFIVTHAGSTLHIDFTLDNEGEPTILLIGLVRQISNTMPTGGLLPTMPVDVARSPAPATFLVPTPQTAPSLGPPPILTGEDIHYFDIIGCISKTKHVVGLEVLCSIIVAGVNKFNVFYAPETGTVVKQKNITPSEISSRVCQGFGEAGSCSDEAVALLVQEDAKTWILMSEYNSQFMGSGWSQDGAYLQLVAGCRVDISKNVAVCVCDFSAPGVVSSGIISFYARDVKTGILTSMTSSMASAVDSYMDESLMRRVLVALAEKLKTARFKCIRLEMDVLQSAVDPKTWKLLSLSGRAEQSEVPISPEAVEPVIPSALTAASTVNPPATATQAPMSTSISAVRTVGTKVKRGGVIAEGRLSKAGVDGEISAEQTAGEQDDKATAEGNSRVVSASSGSRIKSAGWVSLTQNFLLYYFYLIISASAAKVCLGFGILITCCTDQRQAAVQLVCTDKNVLIKKQKKADMDVVRGRVSKIASRKGPGSDVAYMYSKDGRREAVKEPDCALLLSDDNLLNRLKSDKDCYFEVASLSTNPSVVAEVTANMEAFDATTSIASVKFRRRVSDELALGKTDDSVPALDPTSKDAAMAREKLAHMVRIMKEQLKFNVVDMIVEIAISDEECILMYSSFNVSLISR